MCKLSSLLVRQRCPHACVNYKHCVFSSLQIFFYFFLAIAYRPNCALNKRVRRGLTQGCAFGVSFNTSEYIILFRGLNFPNLLTKSSQIEVLGQTKTLNNFWKERGGRKMSTDNLHKAEVLCRLGQVEWLGHFQSAISLVDATTSGRLQEQQKLLDDPQAMED